MSWQRLFITGGLCLALRTPAPSLRADPLVVDDAATLVALEDAGYTLPALVGAPGLAALTRAVKSDVDELRAGATPESPRRLFDPSWLERGRFELVGVVNRIDRRVFEPDGCGEVRFVYRLALKNKRRPVARLPMTVNVRVPQGKPASEPDCRRVAERWASADGAGLRAILAGLPRFAKIETNYQSVHVPATRTDMDDSAEYVLRAFRREGDAVVDDTLFNTPRPDLEPGERAELARWVGAHLAEIDDGSAVVPAPFLATRAISVSPRGLARRENAWFSRALDANALDANGGDAKARDVPAALRDLPLPLPLAARSLVTTPELLARRLDEMTCPGCHQTSGVAGFHLLGQERDARAADGLAIGRSPHFSRDMAFRRDDLARAAKGAPPVARPFAGHPEGRDGDECGLTPGLAAWSCGAGLSCRNIHGGAIGVCAAPPAGRPGDTCEDVTLAPSARPEGPVVTAGAADASCPRPDGYTDGPFCAPNWLGFTGGMCSQRCDQPGALRGRAICARLPAAGYEADCLTSFEPIERCLERHLIAAFVQACDRDTPCRGDFACASVAGAANDKGACVPPYFLFQARVDGPRLDR